MRYTVSNSMKKAEGIFWGILSTIFIVLFIPSIASAQAYVPVVDIQLNPAFINAFGAGSPNGNTDTIRDLISGSDPKGLAKADCALGNNLEGDANPAFAYSAGNWMDAHTQPGNSIPASVPNGVNLSNPSAGPFVQINYSHSLRCLLMEQVEWQKLALSVQIHGLLKNYIADAQTTQLTKQLKNRIAATNLTFAKAGNQVSNGGVQSTAPVFVTGYNQNLFNVNGRQLDQIADQAATDPLSPGPQGSLGVCQPWRIDTAANMVRNARTSVEDPYKYTDTATKCKLSTAVDPDAPFANEGGFTNFSNNFNDPSSLNGGMYTFINLVQHPQNTPIGAQTILDVAASSRIAQQIQSTKSEAANSGFLPTKQCSGDSADPHCLDDQYSIAINPGGQNASNISDLTNKQNDEIISNALDAQGAGGVATSSTDINTNTGLLGANTLPLETSPTAINQLVQEFYDAIQIGYFGIHQDTAEWAQATMLSIYDEMKFNPDLTVNPAATIVTNGRAPQVTGY